MIMDNLEIYAWNLKVKINVKGDVGEIDGLHKSGLRSSAIVRKLQGDFFLKSWPFI
jgi:hypothetical protein